MSIRSRLDRLLGASTRAVSTCPPTRDELLDYPGFHGSRALCHLLVYEADREPPVCIVGNFDGGLGTSTSNALEVVATAVADRIGSDEFRLIEWYPHGYGQPVFEASLERVPATESAYGQVSILGAAADLELTTGHTATARFANPRWAPQGKDELAALLGAEALGELRALAGVRSNYTVERLFGASGRDLADSIREHNGRLFDALVARLAEWSIEP